MEKVKFVCFTGQEMTWELGTKEYRNRAEKREPGGPPSITFHRAAKKPRPALSRHLTLAPHDVRVTTANVMRKCRNCTTRYRTNGRHGQQSSRCRTLHDTAVSLWRRCSYLTTLTSCGRHFVNLNRTWTTSSIPLNSICRNSQINLANTRNHSRLEKTSSGELYKYSYPLYGLSCFLR